MTGARQIWREKRLKMGKQETRLRRNLLARATAAVGGALTAGIAGAVAGQSVAEPPAVQRSTYLVVYRPGPAWLPGKSVKEQPLLEHGRYMQSLYLQGVLKLAGPFSDNAGGAVVFEAQNDREANAVVAADPAVTSHIFLYELHPWGLVRWERFGAG
jgi:uncharacterized protein YciI